MVFDSNIVIMPAMKDAIIEKSIEIIDREGLYGFSVRKVAMCAGCAVGSVYTHFKDLDELILHINGITLDMLNERLLKCKDDIRKIAVEYFKFASSHKNRWSSVLDHRFRTPQDNPVWYQEKIESLLLLLANVVQNKHQCSMEESKRIAILIWSSLHGIWTLWVQNRLSILTDDDPLRLIDLLIEKIS